MPTAAPAKGMYPTQGEAVGRGILKGVACHGFDFWGVSDPLKSLLVTFVDTKVTPRGER